METIILTAAPPSAGGRRLTYIVDGRPVDIDAALNAARDAGCSYPVPDRDDPEAEPTFLNPDQVICCYAKVAR